MSSRSISLRSAQCSFVVCVKGRERKEVDEGMNSERGNSKQVSHVRKTTRVCIKNAFGKHHTIFTEQRKKS